MSSDLATTFERWAEVAAKGAERTNDNAQFMYEDGRAAAWKQAAREVREYAPKWRPEPPRPDEWDDNGGWGVLWAWRCGKALRYFLVGCDGWATCLGLRYPTSREAVKEVIGGEWCRMQGPPP